MKNIHILPTDKPSRLYFNTKAKYYAFSYTVTSQGGSVSNRHIYITSDEEIKEGDWCIDDEGIVKCTAHAGAMNHYYTKIILTTDQDLINDGVQAIDDKFLEWFVKNPSCERIEVEKFAINCSCENQTEAGFGDNKIYENSTCHERNRCDIEYKIIIPKEEPKFEDSIKNSLSIMSIANDMFGKKEEPKQETIEEAVDRASLLEFPIKEWYRSDDYNREEITAARDGFKRGAKWQAERMYSEEEVLEILREFYKVASLKDFPLVTTIPLWFEQFKKK
jgi:hypothetical protein